MEILTAHQRQDNPVGVEFLALLKDIRGKHVIAESAAAPNRNLFRDLLLEDAANLTYWNGVDGHDDFDRLHAHEIIFHLPKCRSQDVRVSILNGNQTGAHKAVGMLKEGARHNQLFRRDVSLIDVARCGSAKRGCVWHHPLHDVPDEPDILIISAVGKDVKQHLPATMFSLPCLPFRNSGAKRILVLKHRLKLLHSGSSSWIITSLSVI